MGGSTRSVDVRKRLGVLLLGIAAWGGLTVAGSPSPDEPVRLEPGTFGGERQMTRPSRDAVLGFSLATRIVEVAARGGSSVKAGDLLIRGEDEEDLALLHLQELRANSDHAVQIARKRSDLAQLEYDRYKEAASQDATAKQELDRARLQADALRLEWEKSRIEQEQEVAQVTRINARIAKFRLAAPFDGRVDEVKVEVGQSVTEGDKVIRVVDVDPLWIDVPARVRDPRTHTLQVGDPAWIVIDLPGPARVRMGRVIELSPVADPSSGTRRIRVEVPNPDESVAGVPSWVRFTEPEGEWKLLIEPAATAARATGGAP